MSKVFMDRDFLLKNDFAKKLYHDYAENEPIFDYHNHLSPKDIAEHRRFHDLTELWLETDHYKWRAMRANGISEDLVTGNAPAYEKFLAWASVVPKLIGSPLYHWTHLELQRYFGITDVLCPDTAEAIWNKTSEMMKGEGFDTVSLLTKMNVKVLCTTDDPADSLEWHKKIREDSTIPFKVFPSFRPDKYLGADPEAEKRLCEKYDTGDDLLLAFSRALDHFCENGCIVSDHGFGLFEYGKDLILTERLNYLGKQYAKRGIAMQLHFGAIRNTVPSLKAGFGPDAGADSVGFTTDSSCVAAFLGKLEGEGSLPRTVLYDLNPSDNAMLSTMAGNFAPKVQFGAAWWFNDHMRGIRRQLDELMETNALACSVGMLTDSRSFTSFPRHEYFRRILCARLAELVENGEYPEDIVSAGSIVKNVCYGNADRFFMTR